MKHLHRIFEFILRRIPNSMYISVISCICSVLKVNFFRPNWWRKSFFLCNTQFGLSKCSTLAGLVEMNTKCRQKRNQWKIIHMQTHTNKQINTHSHRRANRHQRSGLDQPSPSLRSALIINWVGKLNQKLYVWFTIVVIFFSFQKKNGRNLHCVSVYISALIVVLDTRIIIPLFKMKRSSFYNTQKLLIKISDDKKSNNKNWLIRAADSKIKLLLTVIYQSLSQTRSTLCKSRFNCCKSSATAKYSTQ